MRRHDDGGAGGAEAEELREKLKEQEEELGDLRQAAAARRVRDGRHAFGQNDEDQLDDEQALAGCKRLLAHAKLCIVKHGRTGRPKLRSLFSTDDCAHVFWQPADASEDGAPGTVGAPATVRPRLDRSIAIVDVDAVILGKRTRNFARTGRDAPGKLCFSLVTKQRTLDIEFRAQDAKYFCILTRGLTLLMESAHKRHPRFGLPTAFGETRAPHCGNLGV
eukprot:g1903.t1